MNSTINGTMNNNDDDSQFDANGRFRRSEYQRLLHVES